MISPVTIYSITIILYAKCTLLTMYGVTCPFEAVHNALSLSYKSACDQ